MADITRTKVGTNDPLNICDGVAIWPQLGSFDAGVNIANRSQSLINSAQQILLWKYDIYFYYNLQVGLCGPAWATNLDVGGSSDENGLDMTIYDDNTGAGFFLGAIFTLGLRGAVAQLEYHVTCSHWHVSVYTTWSTNLRFNAAVSIDFIRVLLSLLQDDADGEVEDEGDAIGMSSFSMYKMMSNRFNSGNGTFTIEPLLNFPIDILPYIPEFGEVIEACDDIGAKIKSGPMISLGLPIAMSIDKVMANDYQYTDLHFDNGRVTSSTVSAFTTGNEVQLDFQWTPSIDLRLGWFANFSLWSLFSFGASYTFSIVDALGINTATGTYNHTLSNTMGSTELYAGLSDEKPTKLAKVVFHEPEVA